MRTDIKEMFEFLDGQKVRYYLLRPLDLRKEIEDIDIIIPKEDFDALITSLSKTYKKVLFRNSNANASVQVIANGILLDIKFSICFLPGKTLVLKESSPYAGVRKLSNDILVPDVSEEVLFTFWTYHLFLDKPIPEKSSTYDIYKELYDTRWEACIDTVFFKKWTNIIFNKKSDIVREILVSYFIGERELVKKETNKLMRGLVFKNRPALKFNYVIDRIKFAAQRRLGIHDRYKNITKITD
ncbi:hypothetical protein B0O79_1991 [Flavobacteriaceae bacterium MAR_2009_75]|nr:hypothetical protein B0O79_1991 [Flavobacteriaceae bacterium MAR_2009_75]